MAEVGLPPGTITYTHTHVSTHISRAHTCSYHPGEQNIIIEIKTNINNIIDFEEETPHSIYEVLMISNHIVYDLTQRTTKQTRYMRNI